MRTLIVDPRLYRIFRRDDRIIAHLKQGAFPGHFIKYNCPVHSLKLDCTVWLDQFNEPNMANSETMEFEDEVT